MYIFHVENDRRFPFSLVLSISHLDHFRGISSRRSPSISPLLVNEKVVDHFFEILNDKKKRKKRGKKRSGESISGLKTRSLVLSRNPFRYYQHQFFESVRSLTLLYRQEKKSWRIYLPSSISNTVSSISKLKGKKKKMTHSGTIDFSPLLNFIFVGMLIKIFTSFPNLFVVSSCDFFIQLLIIIYLSI